MLYREIIAVCSQIHTKHINTVCGQDFVFFNVKLVANKAPKGLKGVTLCSSVVTVCTTSLTLNNSTSLWLFRWCGCSHTTEPTTTMYFQ